MAFDTRKIWTSPQLPTLSVVGMRVLEHSRNPANASRELALLLNADAKLAGKFLSAANSPLGALSSPVNSIDQALSALGVTNTISLVLNLLLVELYQSRISNVTNTTDAEFQADPPINSSEHEPLIEHANRFWRRAVAKAVAAEMLCQHVRDGLESEYFLAGLTLDLGWYVLLRTAPQEFLSILGHSRRANLPRCECERSELGQTAAEFGGQLLGQWGFPTRLVRGVQSQHAGLAAFQDSEPHSECSLSRALALASAMGDYLCDDQQAISLFRIRELTKTLLPMQEAEFDTLLQAVIERIDAIAFVFAPDKSAVLSPRFANAGELKAKAIEQLTSLCGRSTDAEVRTGRRSLPLPSDIERRGLPKDAQHEVSRSNKDPLTQVFNREYFEATLNKEVQRCCQVAAPLGIAVVEVDQYNDLVQRFGTGFGDVVLQRIGGILNELLRSSDTTARVGRQFMILASNPTAKGLQKLSDRIRARVEGEQLDWEGQSLPITVSVGASMALPGRTDLGIGRKVIAAAQKATREAAFGEGNNIYFSSLVDEVELNRLFMANQMRFSRWLVSQGVLDIPRVAKALLSFQQRTLRMGDLAIRQELLSQDEVDDVLADQEESNARFGDIAVRRTYLTEDQLTGLLILQQEDPILVASLFMKLSLLEPQRLKGLLQDYFKVVPWAAPLYPTAGKG